MTTKEAEMAKGISEIVGVFCDPIVVYPGGWGDTIPDWLKAAVKLERLIMNVEALKTGEMTGTDAEACIYLYTACLCFPFDHDWTQIYLHVAGKVYERHRTKESGVTMPGDIRVDELNRNQIDDLNRLKRWLYERRVKARQEKERAERREAKEAAERAMGKQMGMELVFDFKE